MTRYFKYLLLTVFVATVLLIVFLQFNSNRSINKLIDSNENLLNDFGVKESLQHLTAEIIALESKVRGSIIAGSATDTDQFRSEINSINGSLRELDTLAYDQPLQPLIADLRNLVNAKMEFSRYVLQTYREQGKQEAEKLINAQAGSTLADSIKQITHQIDELHEAYVTNFIRDADRNGLNARTMGTILAVIAVAAAIFTFAYVAFRVRQQQRLIDRLNLSEKQAKEAARIKENFLANMSHEIRTPLNAILGFTDLLQHRPLDQQSQQHVQTIQRSGENLLAIVNDVLDLSKIEAGMMRIESAPFSIRALVQSVDTMFHSRAAEKNLHLNTFVDATLPDILEGDAVRLTQILVNLVSNAIKFTSQGTIDIRIQKKEMHENKVQLTIIVSDTGIGIKKEKLDTIFDRFHQAEDSVTRKYGGTGLGLAIVHELVYLQNGTIVAESEEGKGTTFTITIPYLVSSKTVEKKHVAPEKSTAAQSVTNARILVVEDNEINQSLLTHLLKAWHMEFDIAGNGKEALDRLAQKKYDLVLMDVQMPVMDGYTATRIIRQELRSDIPIIAMTAHAMTGEREKCLAQGMNEYISKPIRDEQLHYLIAQFVHSNGKDQYRYINLGYMREISMGNSEYEKAVTGQFIEVIPEDLAHIEEAWQKNNIAALRRVAHNMKTSISVMGLNETLDPWLDQLEYGDLDETSFKNAFSHLQLTCHAALEEARHFYGK
jgi:signal transduction histidine kinase/DNA-binding NarL/FixJ family response regulator